MIKSKIKSFLRFYKTKLESMNAISLQNINNLKTDADKFREVTKEELKNKQKYSF